MKTELQIFTDLAWQEKINYMVSFYQSMIKKTDNSDYAALFQAKVDEVKWYQENAENTNKLDALYDRIIWAKEKTKQRKIEEMQQHIEKEKAKLDDMQSSTNEPDPDEYLAEALAKI